MSSSSPGVPAGRVFHADISRIDRYAPSELIGRDAELARLSDAWARVQRAESRRPHVITVVALGGEGKTSLVAKWAAGLAAEGWPGCEAAFAWSFYSQGTACGGGVTPPFRRKRSRIFSAISSAGRAPMSM